MNLALNPTALQGALPNVPDRTAETAAATSAGSGQAFDLQGPPAPAAADPTRVAGPGKVEGDIGLFGPMREFGRILNKFQEFNKACATKETHFREQGLTADHPDVAAHRQDRMAKMLEFQVAVQDAGYRLELAGKVIEHGTQGTRTILQTQT
ncbi:MAG: hypothetical protein AAF628_22935 [Planctomycetota bacterium]